MNSIGQTAREIAEFWCHEDVVKFLTPNESDKTYVTPLVDNVKRVNYFSGNPLNRMSHRRKDDDWLQQLSTCQSTIYILFSNLDPLVKQCSDNRSFQLLRFAHDQIETCLKSKPTIVFLGMDLSCADEVKVNDGIGWFAVDVGPLSNEQMHELHADAVIVTLRSGLLQLLNTEASIVAQARSVLAWLDRYQFCPTCGSATYITDAGYKRTCVKEDCKSNKGLFSSN